MSCCLKIKTINYNILKWNKINRNWNWEKNKRREEHVSLIKLENHFVFISWIKSHNLFFLLKKHKKFNIDLNCFENKKDKNRKKIQEESILYYSLIKLYL